MSFFVRVLQKEVGMKAFTDQPSLHIYLAGEYRIDTTIRDVLTQIVQSIGSGHGRHPLYAITESKVLAPRCVAFMDRSLYCSTMFRAPDGSTSPLRLQR